MQVHEFGRMTGTGEITSAALNTSDGSGKSPFTEGREVMLVVSPTDNFAVTTTAGSVAVQSDNAATPSAWTGDLLSTQEEADVVAGMTIMKTITLPAHIRVRLDTVTTGAVRAYLVAAGS